MSGPKSRRCAQWNTPLTQQFHTISVHNSVCFDADSRPVEVFSRTLGVHYFDYNSFEGISFPRLWELFDARITLLVHVEKLESLKESSELFSVASDTGYAARLRFVSPPDSAYSDYTPVTSSFAWPVVHNFPATGAMAVCGQIDRRGNLAVLETLISPNVVVTDSAREQLKNAKFKPFLVDGYPVQVNACFGLHFEARMQMYGDNSAGLLTIPFLTRISDSRQLSDLHFSGTPPFHRVLTFKYADGTAGKYEETWLAPAKWRIEISGKNVTVVTAQNGDNLYKKVVGTGDSRKFLDDVIAEINGKFPRTDGSFIEADWGHSALKWSGVDTVRVARGAVSEKNEPTSGQAYWFDAKGVLLGEYVMPRTSRYTHFSTWDQKFLPYGIEVSEKGETVLTISLDKLEPAVSRPDSTFVLEGVAPTNLKHSSDEPHLVMAKPKIQVAPQNPSHLKEVVVVAVQVDENGHVADGKIQSSAGAELDAASLEAAKQWEFEPMQISGKPVPVALRLTFRF